MIYLSIQALESIIYIVFEWIKQHFNDLNDKLNGYKSQNGNMQYASTDCILMFIMVIIYIIYVVYQLINYLLFQEMILLYQFIRIIIVFFVYWIILCNFCNQTMKLFAHCIIFIMTEFHLWYLINLYRLEWGLVIIVLNNDSLLTFDYQQQQPFQVVIYNGCCSSVAGI